MPSSGGTSIDLIDWSLPDGDTTLVSFSKNSNGHVIVTMSNGQTLNLNEVQHHVIRILDIPLAIETRESGFSFVDVTPDVLYDIMIPGIVVQHGFPAYGSQFNVVVGCNPP